MFKNTLKEKLLAGKHCFGMLDSTACCEVVEMLGWLGIDFILLDAEHGKLNLENLENLIRAAEHSGIAPIVRPPALLREWIGPVLDRGAWGLYLPHFNTAEDAKMVVSAAKYYPNGLRGYMPVGRPNHFGYDMLAKEFLEKSNEETFIIGLVEEIEGINNLDEILEVDGIDAIWLGCGDLSQTMGYLAQPDHPEVVKVMDEAVKKIVAAGKIAGVATTEPLMQHYMELGALLFHGLVQGLMKEGVESYMGRRNAEIAALRK